MQRLCKDYFMHNSYVLITLALFSYISQLNREVLKKNSITMNKIKFLDKQLRLSKKLLL